MTSASAHRPSPDDTSLEDAVSAVTAAEEALRAARRNLTAVITVARQAGESVPRIAQRTGMDAVTVRNILAATAVPAKLPRSRSSRPR